MSDTSSAKKSLLRSPAVYIAVILSCLFLGFFYLAVTNEPDYMPSQQNKNAHATHQAAPSSSSEPTASEMGMTEEEHANMDSNQETSAAHGH
ncbi:hypothetical protein A3K93_09590 [Acinetobacter sp. NCu2D-2]|uniref:hypothetical protein n=1 Tax=Acinetobacter sp. NCu2D-2 TaxID=1608473 RepID=UPI0007CDFFF4|nr:hypothetical protein [Acinetobacter sp. NCu2D-2]ANF82424.1 hypothetical protein A3K93_09590 [Acinetobacter sp. NCu2D-2]